MMTIMGTGAWQTKALIEQRKEQKSNKKMERPEAIEHQNDVSVVEENRGKK